FVDCGAHIDALVQSVSDFQRLGAVHVTRDELTVDALLHDDAAGRGAALSSGAEAAPESAFDGEIEIRIIEHDHRILATEFEGAMLEGLRGRGADDASDFGC